MNETQIINLAEDIRLLEKYINALLHAFEERHNLTVTDIYSVKEKNPNPCGRVEFTNCKIKLQA